MKLKSYARISNRLYGKPWALYEPQWHNLHAIYQNHIKNGSLVKKSDIEFDDDNGESATSYTVVGKVGIVSLNGVILKHASLLEQICGAVDVDSFLQNVTAAFKDTNVESILLDINSPGGEVTGVKEAADKIRMMAKTKQIVSFTDSLCASAAYWIAAATDGIFTTETAEIGSIGVYVGMYDYSVAFSQEGVKPVLIKSGKFKGDGFPGLPIGEDTISRIQAEVDQTNDIFRGAIALKRDLKDDDMQGQTFMGMNAVKNGISDALVTCINDLVSALNSETN